VIDTAAIFIVMLFALHGYWRGLLRKLAGIGAFIIASITVGMVAERAAAWISQRWDVHPMLVYLPCCVVGWFAIFIICRVLLGFVAAALGGGADGKPSSWNRQLGAVFGAVEALALCWFVVGILLSFPPDWRRERMPAVHSALGESRFALITQKTNPSIFVAFGTLISDMDVLASEPEALEELAADPAVRKVVAHKKVLEVLNDEGLVKEWRQGRRMSFLTDRKVLNALEDSEVAGLLRDPEFREAVHKVADRVRRERKGK
jgi:uncharacterized membrane protein required for colicin V production